MEQFNLKKLGVSKSFFDIDIITANLQSNGIEYKRIDSDITETNLLYSEVYVKSEDVERSKTIINNLDLQDFIEFEN